ncbi:MAG: hypothetical protein HN964_05190 [Candidatus Jacksonbacteria bacterium]|jgi:glutamate--cysteine ligase|nr:hypothetical protein [Candidatus Jacksonbacteria bacterium]
MNTIHEKDQLWQRVTKSKFFFIKEAVKRGIQCEILKDTCAYKLQYKKKVRYFYDLTPSTTTAFAIYCCKNKNITNNILSNNKVSVNKGMLIKKDDSKVHKEKIYNSLIKPLAVKPANSLQGNNVFLNVNSKREFFSSLKRIFDAYGDRRVSVLAEEMFVGEEYRILATQNKILSVIHRLPANVVGDGASSIKKLVEIKNADPLRKSVDTYKKIKLEKEVEAYLSLQDLTINSVLKKDQQVYLQPSTPSDMDLGGDTIDITDSIHSSVKKVVLRIMKSIPGLSLAGIDYMSKDIFSEQNLDVYRVIEVNNSPSLDWNEFPLVGKRRNVSFEILKIMFPELKK